MTVKECQSGVKKCQNISVTLIFYTVIMAAIRLHPVTKKPSVYWYEPNGKKRQKTFATAIEEDMIYKNPCKTSIVRSSISAQEFREQRYLTKEELIWLTESIDPHFKELILFAGLTGLRKGELFALDASDIQGSTVAVSKSLSLIRGESVLTQTKTPKSVRSVEIPEELVYYFHDRKAGPVFTSLQGNRIQPNNFRKRYFIPAVEKSIGKPFRFHDLRHTAVALAIKDKKHPFEISKMLGHTSIKTTFDVYGHLL